MPDQIVEAEGGRLRTGDGGAGQGVDFLDRVTLGQGMVQPDRPGDRENAVGDEVGRVLADDDALAQPVFAEALQEGDQLGVGVLASGSARAACR